MPPVKRARTKRSDGLFPCEQFDDTGSCTYGDKCKFSHLGKDDPGLPAGVSKLPKNKRKRNGICLKFAEFGECDFGDNCRYRHMTDSDFAKKQAADALMIATALGTSACGCEYDVTDVPSDAFGNGDTTRCLHTGTGECTQVCIG